MPLKLFNFMHSNPPILKKENRKTTKTLNELKGEMWFYWNFKHRTWEHTLILRDDDDGTKGTEEISNIKTTEN